MNSANGLKESPHLDLKTAIADYLLITPDSLTVQDMLRVHRQLVAPTQCKTQGGQNIEGPSARVGLLLDHESKSKSYFRELVTERTKHLLEGWNLSYKEIRGDEELIGKDEPGLLCVNLKAKAISLAVYRLAVYGFGAALDCLPEAQREFRITPTALYYLYRLFDSDPCRVLAGLTDVVSIVSETENRLLDEDALISRFESFKVGVLDEIAKGSTLCAELESEILWSLWWGRLLATRRIRVGEVLEEYPPTWVSVKDTERFWKCVHEFQRMPRGQNAFTGDEKRDKQVFANVQKIFNSGQETTDCRTAIEAAEKYFGISGYCQSVPSARDIDELRPIIREWVGLPTEHSVCITSDGSQFYVSEQVYGTTADQQKLLSALIAVNGGAMKWAEICNRDAGISLKKDSISAPALAEILKDANGQVLKEHVLSNKGGATNSARWALRETVQIITPEQMRQLEQLAKHVNRVVVSS